MFAATPMLLLGVLGAAPPQHTVVVNTSNVIYGPTHLCSCSCCSSLTAHPLPSCTNSALHLLACHGERSCTAIVVCRVRSNLIGRQHQLTNCSIILTCHRRVGLYNHLLLLSLHQPRAPRAAAQLQRAPWCLFAARGLQWRSGASPSDYPTLSPRAPHLTGVRQSAGQPFGRRGQVLRTAANPRRLHPSLHPVQRPLRRGHLQFLFVPRDGLPNG